MLETLLLALKEAPLQDGNKLCCDNKDGLELFSRYWQTVKITNESFNLTAITDDDEAAVKHYWDSLYAASFLPKGAKCLDLGSGAGFPGMVLAIMRPDTEWLLLDSLNKRCAFLERAALELGLNNVKVIHARAEEAGRNKDLRGKFDIVTARAVTAMPVLLELSMPLLREKGHLLALKGPALSAELQEAKNSFLILKAEIAHLQEYSLPLCHDMRTLCVVEKHGKTPDKYPRKAGMPQKAPL